MSERLSKTCIKTATGKAGAAMAELIKVLQVKGVEANLSKEEFDKIFTFLHSTLDALEEQARRDRVVASAGAFDFDMEIAPARPEPPFTASATRPSHPIFNHLRDPATNAAHPSIVTPAPDPVVESEYLAPGATEWKKPTGRIAKASPNAELAGQAVHVPIKTKTAPNTLDGVGQVGDETKKAGPVGFMDN